MTRKQAETQLQKLFGFDHFFDLQWQVIEHLLAGRRVLFIEKARFDRM
jgi:ATP-dependent DNA helicase RecQ